MKRQGELVGALPESESFVLTRPQNLSCPGFLHDRKKSQKYLHNPNPTYIRYISGFFQVPKKSKLFDTSKCLWPLTMTAWLSRPYKSTSDKVARIKSRNHSVGIPCSFCLYSLCMMTCTKFDVCFSLLSQVYTIISTKTYSRGLLIGVRFKSLQSLLFQGWFGTSKWPCCMMVL